VELIQTAKNNSQILGYATRESITATTWLLKISQHEKNLKHENFTVSNYICSILLPQNNIQSHFSCYRPSSKHFAASH